MPPMGKDMVKDKGNRKPSASTGHETSDTEDPSRRGNMPGQIRHRDQVDGAMPQPPARGSNASTVKTPGRSPKVGKEQEGGDGVDNENSKSRILDKISSFTYDQWVIGGLVVLCLAYLLSEIQTLKYSNIPISSCKDVYDRAGPNGVVSGEYNLTSDEGELYKVYCEFHYTHIFTFITPTSLPSIPLDNLYNNKKEVLIRHRLDDGTQREVKYSQIQKYRERGISVQYNQNDGYNAIQNSKMGPYIYVGLLPIVGIEHKGDIQGYSVDGIDFTFTNCDGNPNNYFALLFNKNNEQFTGYNVDQPMMRRWLTFSSLVPTESELPEEFFSQFEMHMGGCGGYLTSNQVSLFDGATIGLRYDLRISSCKDVYDRAGPNGAVSGEYYLTKGKDKRYKVYCEFYDTHIYTFVAPTSFASIPLDKLYNNKKEVLIRHRLDDGTQREVKYSQIQKYREQDISVQYNQNDGYNAIQNSNMGPYIYVGLLPIVGIEHKGDIQGYSVDGRDFTFTNCDGNPNNYFSLLFNENNEQFTGYNADQPLMRRWLTFSSLVPTESELPEDFFSQFEMHMGGCGGYLTSNQVSRFDGATIGLRYDIHSS